MSQHDDDECTLATCVCQSAAKHGYDHHDAANRIEICLKIIRHDIPVSRFIVEGVPVCDVSSRMAETKAPR